MPGTPAWETGQTHLVPPNVTGCELVSLAMFLAPMCTVRGAILATPDKTPSAAAKEHMCWPKGVHYYQ